MTELIWLNSMRAAIYRAEKECQAFRDRVTECEADDVQQMSHIASIIHAVNEIKPSLLPLAEEELYKLHTAYVRGERFNALDICFDVAALCILAAEQIEKEILGDDEEK